MWYNIDFNKLAKLLVPYMFRGSGIMNMIHILLTPLKYLYGLFTEYREKTIEKLNITGNVIVLETYLNKKCGSTGIVIESLGRGNGRIYYDKKESQAANYMWGQSENKRISLTYKLELVTDDDFVVKIPSSLSTQVQAIKNIVNIYKPAGKSYHTTLI